MVPIDSLQQQKTNKNPNNCIYDLLNIFDCILTFQATTKLYTKINVNNSKPINRHYEDEKKRKTKEIKLDLDLQ